MKKEESEALKSMLDSLGCLAYLKDIVDEVYMLRQSVDRIAKQLENFEFEASNDN